MITVQSFLSDCTRPIVTRLQDDRLNGLVDFSVKPRSDVEWALLEMVIDAGLISPIGYGESVTDVQLLRGTCITAFGATDDLNLFFKPGLHQLNTVACLEISPSDTVLAGIILKEKYKMNPRMVPVKADFNTAYNSADAVLVNTKRTEYAADSVMDIVDEWWDMTQLPYVKYFFAGWKDRITEGFNDALNAIGNEVDSLAVEEIRNTLDGALTDDPVHQIPGHYRYIFDDEAFNGLTEYFRYAFFHGLHKDVPDVAFWETNEKPGEQGLDRVS